MNNEASTKKSILVAEDDQFYANIYRVKLAKEGFDVEIVGNGEEALEAVRRKKPDLLILDLIMPVKDGFAVLKELNADAALKDVKVVVLSNLGQAEDVKKAKDLGAKDYIIKTNVSIQEMITKIKGYLS